jgi:hypothetical protein
LKPAIAGLLDIASLPRERPSRAGEVLLIGLLVTGAPDAPARAAAALAGLLAALRPAPPG